MTKEIRQDALEKVALFRNDKNIVVVEVIQRKWFKENAVVIDVQYASNLSVTQSDELISILVEATTLAEEWSKEV